MSTPQKTRENLSPGGHFDYFLIVKLRYTNTDMAITKTELFSEKQKRAAGYAKALAHPARIAILELLVERPGCICGDITEELPLAQSTVSQHLKALKKAGVIRGEVEGVRVCYCLDEEHTRKLVESLKELSETLIESIQNNTT